MVYLRKVRGESQFETPLDVPRGSILSTKYIRKQSGPNSDRPMEVVAPSTLEYSTTATTRLSGGGGGGGVEEGGAGEAGLPAGGLWGLRSQMVGRQQEASGVRLRWQEAQKKLATAKQRAEGLRRHQEKLVANKKRVDQLLAQTTRQIELLARDMAQQGLVPPGPG